MLKKSSLGSWWSPSPTRCPRLLWVILRPGRLPTLTRWSSRRRLWELAIRSNSSSVWGEVVIPGSRRKEKKIRLEHMYLILSGFFKIADKWPNGHANTILNRPIISFRDGMEFAAPSPWSPFCGSSRRQRWSSMRLLWNLLRRSKKQSSSDGSRPSFWTIKWRVETHRLLFSTKRQRLNHLSFEILSFVHLLLPGSRLPHIFRWSNEEFYPAFKLPLASIPRCIYSWMRLLNNELDEDFQDGQLVDEKNNPINFQGKAFLLRLPWPRYWRWYSIIKRVKMNSTMAHIGVHC